MKASHTTKTKKAKCLHYRNGKRCGRVAKALVCYQNPATLHLGKTTIPMCEDCSKMGEVIEFSPKGFSIQITGFGTQSRQYRRI